MSAPPIAFGSWTKRPHPRKIGGIVSCPRETANCAPDYFRYAFDPSFCGRAPRWDIATACTGANCLRWFAPWGRFGTSGLHMYGNRRATICSQALELYNLILYFDISGYWVLLHRTSDCHSSFSQRTSDSPGISYRTVDDGSDFSGYVHPSIHRRALCAEPRRNLWKVPQMHKAR